MKETGRLWEEYPVIYEAAERLVATLDENDGGASWNLAESGLAVARTGDGAYEVRLDGLLVFRCRNGEAPEVFRPGEWVVRLVHAGRSTPADGTSDAGPPRGAA